VEIWHNGGYLPDRDTIVILAVKKAPAFRAFQWQIPGSNNQPASLIDGAIGWIYFGKSTQSVQVTVRLTPSDQNVAAKSMTITVTRPTSVQTRKRYNVFAMPSDALKSYFTAANCIKTLGVWDFFVKAHLQVSSARQMGQISTDAHGSPAFPVFHRLFIELFERSLLACGLTVGYGAPFMRPELMTSVDDNCLWTSDMYGTRSGRVKSGFMATWTGYGTDHQAAGTERIVRAPPGRLYDIKAQVSQWKSSYTNCNAFGFTTMRQLLEGMHNMGHVNIGGDMGNMASPNDACFWLVHLRTEKQYSDWQNACPAIALSYNGQNRMGDVAKDTDLLDPWKIPVKSWLPVPTFVQYANDCGSKCIQCEGPWNE